MYKFKLIYFLNFVLSIESFCPKPYFCLMLWEKAYSLLVTDNTCWSISTLAPALGKSNTSKHAHVEFIPVLVGKVILWGVWLTPERKPHCDQYITQHESSCRDPTDITALSIVLYVHQFDVFKSSCASILLIFRCSFAPMGTARE